MHVYEKFRLNIDQLKEEWEKQFEVKWTKCPEPNGVLNINDTAQDLFKEIIREYGGFNNRIFSEQHARVALKRAANIRETINVQEFAEAIANGIMKLTDNSRIVLPDRTNVDGLMGVGICRGCMHLSFTRRMR